MIDIWCRSIFPLQKIISNYETSLLSLNADIYKNFQPVSNVSFLSKIIEKIVASHIFQQMTENGLHDKMQCTYKTCHSTETSLPCVKNDILTVLDNKIRSFSCTY